jgi:hypothetical protein
VINELRAANSAYGNKIAFVRVNWDKHRRSPISKDFNVFRQSTLVTLANDGEIGRLVAQTDRSKIKGLLDRALAASRAGNGASCSG